MIRVDKNKPYRGILSMIGLPIFTKNKCRINGSKVPSPVLGFDHVQSRQLRVQSRHQAQYSHLEFQQIAHWVFSGRFRVRMIFERACASMNIGQVEF